ncbi:immunoglobulin heavy chain variable domain-containing protein, partial [Corynebacterium sp. TA-R-1]
MRGGAGAATGALSATQGCRRLPHFCRKPSQGLKLSCEPSAIGEEFQMNYPLAVRERAVELYGKGLEPQQV